MDRIPLDKLLLKDKQILCIDCGKVFTFTVGEQRYFLSKDLVEPRRCPSCRAWRKSTIAHQYNQGGGNNA